MLSCMPIYVLHVISNICWYVTHIKVSLTNQTLDYPLTHHLSQIRLGLSNEIIKHHLYCVGKTDDGILLHRILYFTILYFMVLLYSHRFRPCVLHHVQLVSQELPVQWDLRLARLWANKQKSVSQSAWAIVARETPFSCGKVSSPLRGRWARTVFKKLESYRLS